MAEKVIRGPFRSRPRTGYLQHAVVLVADDEGWGTLKSLCGRIQSYAVPPVGMRDIVDGDGSSYGYIVKSRPAFDATLHDTCKKCAALAALGEDGNQK